MWFAHVILFCESGLPHPLDNVFDAQDFNVDEPVSLPFVFIFVVVCALVSKLRNHCQVHGGEILTPCSLLRVLQFCSYIYITFILHILYMGYEVRIQQLFYYIWISSWPSLICRRDSSYHFIFSIDTSGCF